MTEFQLPNTLRKHRSLLLACEAIGWLHMTGKAKIDFLRDPEKNQDKCWYSDPSVPSASSFDWLNCHLKQFKQSFPKNFFKKFENKTSQPHFVGLLQAGHAMASGIEKNFHSSTTKYLGQDVTHMWLSTAFGHPVRNLIADPPELLTQSGWKRLLEQVENLLTELRELDSKASLDIDGWWRWRDGAVGLNGWLRKELSSTLAETRLPNNDVTLFDQSYIAAALFKSAAAGAILEGKLFPWQDNKLKQQTRWRILTIGIGTNHYEARAVKIGDWTGVRLTLDEFFTKVCKLVEVDLAIGSLLYADGEVSVFSFPGERFGHDKKEYNVGNLHIKDWQSCLTKQIDAYACEAKLEMPPYCSISDPSRSLVKMTAEIRQARETMAVPLHRNWQIPRQDSSDGHVCPVCLVRRSHSWTDKQRPCDPCKDRRTHRLDKWLKGEFESDSIWISEVADANDRVALVTMSLDIEPWLDGTRLDALRTQAIPEWYKHNPTRCKDIDPTNCFGSLFQCIKGKFQSFNEKDLLLSSLQEGYRFDTDWPSFFSKIVEDRTNAPQWDAIDESCRAGWLAHQFFRKLASPGRIYRFERQADEFFKAMLDEFRDIAAADQNRWRVRRLIVKPDNGSYASWEDRQTYGGRYEGAAVSLLYQEQTKDFLTICNVARLLKAEQDKDCLHGITLQLKADDSMELRPLVVRSTEDFAGALGEYHPVIPLELSPVRFRVLLPLEVASTCVDRAILAWRDQFARIWDRLPLRVGIVAFPRMTPFQAVIEAARNVERDLDGIKNPEAWRVAGCQTREGVTSLSIKSSDHRQELLQTIPIRFPDGREDVFYPYVAVEDRLVRFPMDFRHPNGQVFRHAKNLQVGDGVLIYPSLTATLFMDGTASRFEPLCRRELTEWLQMRDLWRLMSRHVPSQTALRGAWSEIVERREAWQGTDGTWFEGGREAWLDFARAVFYERLGVRGSCLETLVKATGDGILEWSLEWHMSVLKKQVYGDER